MRYNPLGIYEKAMPKSLTWPERFQMVKDGGFDFFEISIDETDARAARLDWSFEERLNFVKLKHEYGIQVPSMCLSAHRKYPFGSRDTATREKAMDIMKKAIDFSLETGVRTIQLAGYDVYYEEASEETVANFTQGLSEAVRLAASAQVMLAVEIMDTPFMSSITKWKYWDELLKSPWFCVYPDVGNLTAWNNDVSHELQLGIDKIAAIHLKETLKVSDTCKGQFRDMRFGEGQVDFKAIFTKLKELNYRGTFLLEMWGESDDNALAHIIEARKFIEREMSAVGYPLLAK